MNPYCLQLLLSVQNDFTCVQCQIVIVVVRLSLNNHLHEGVYVHIQEIVQESIQPVWKKEFVLVNKIL
jgi:hypothetical protein